jgi:hypothetical protein
MIAFTVFALIVTKHNETKIHLFILGQNYIPLSIEVRKEIRFERKFDKKILSEASEPFHFHLNLDP